ncbi:AraC family transcriptional regulator [Altericroceibacterium xinjiangense]|uniref:AraC family transcriptional regulator n=1 Tax=Altericroceibacterium xinjiangense TaxID=762261 RepID=UPI000F7F68C9|nr:AraC family transcriptional regulator [Altericroceibacterium xinjiangense]
MTEPTISVLFLRHIANCVELAGHSCTPLLAEFGLCRHALEDREGTIPLKDFLRFFERAAEHSQNLHFGLQAGRLASADSLGPLSFLFLSAPSLGDAFHAFVRYLDTMQQAARNAFRVDGGTATFEYLILDPGLGVRRQDAEYSIGTTYTLAKNFCGGRLPVKEVCFEHSQAGEYLRYRDFFGCDVFFEQSANSISFDAGVLNEPGQMLSPELFPILVDHLQRKARARPGEDDVVARLDGWLASADISSPLNLGDAAHALGLSSQTLQRGLQQKGLCWRDLLHRRRMEAATRLLIESRRSIADIAVATGYAESASFIRAFKIDSGQTPARFRKHFGS